MPTKTIQQKENSKRSAIFPLNLRKNDQPFSRNYYDQLLKPITPNYEVKLANQLTEDFLHRSSYKPISILSNIERIPPELIISLVLTKQASEAQPQNVWKALKWSKLTKEQED